MNLPDTNLEKSWSKLDWLIILIFAALVILFFWRIITPNLADRQSFPPGDFHAQFWAFATFEVRELSAGRLPLWNRFTFAGAPFWADVQSAVFYPPSLLTLLLSAPWGFSLFALEIEAIFHFWLAAVFMYLFIRRVTRSRAAAVIAALTFTFSGYLTGYPSQQLAVLEADVWLPLILFFLYKAHHTKIAAYLILAGLAWGLTLLAGHPQSAFIVACVSSAYFFFLWLSETKNQPPESHPPHNALPLQAISWGHTTLRSLPRAISAWLIFILTGLGLAAVQFIPATEYTLLSVRAEGIYDQMSGGLPVTDLVQILLPGQVSLYSPLYIGLVGLILAVCVVFARPTRHPIFWAVTAAVTLVVSFGGNTFLYSTLYLSTPGFAIFRGQERWAFAVAFSLAVLAGYGFKEMLGQVTGGRGAGKQVAGSKESGNIAIRHSLSTIRYASRPFTTHLQSLTTYLFLLALLFTFLFFYGLNDTGWTPNNPFFGLLGASTQLTIILALTWLLWRFAPRLHPALLTTLAAAIICFDLFSVNWQTNLYPQLPEWHTQTPPIVEVIKEDAAQSPDQSYRVYNEFRLYDNYGVPYGIEDLWGASPLRPNRYDQFLAPPMPIERTWELLNVKYVITWREDLYLPSTIIYQEPAADGTTYVHRLESVGPRAWLVGEAQIADDATILGKIADSNFDRWNIALLEPGAESDIALLSESTSTNSMSSTQHAVDITQHTTHSLSASIETSSPTLLILSEPFYPGWQATLDGEPAPLLRADYILRAVPVPPGQHQISLTFSPLSFQIGAIISIITLIVAAIRLWLFFYRRGSR